MTRVKICGITNHDDLQAAVESGADAIGVIADVSVETPREVSPDRATELIDAVPPFVTSVLVTMPTDPVQTAELANTIRPDVVQVHGHLGAGDVAYLAAKTDAALMKAITSNDADIAHRFADVVDALVVDTETAGGTGRTHDWSATRELVVDLDVPVILAGGLSPANVREAVTTVRPYGVDVSSGVERAGGKKDHAAIETFVAHAKKRPEVVHGP